LPFFELIVFNQNEDIKGRPKEETFEIHIEQAGEIGELDLVRDSAQWRVFKSAHGLLDVTPIDEAVLGATVVDVDAAAAAKLPAKRSVKGKLTVAAPTPEAEAEPKPETEPGVKPSSLAAPRARIYSITVPAAGTVHLPFHWSAYAGGSVAPSGANLLQSTSPIAEWQQLLGARSPPSEAPFAAVAGLRHAIGSGRYIIDPALTDSARPAGRIVVKGKRLGNPSTFTRAHVSSTGQSPVCFACRYGGKASDPALPAPTRV
jgi:hypothetical protein